MNISGFRLTAKCDRLGLWSSRKLCTKSTPFSASRKKWETRSPEYHTGEGFRKPRLDAAKGHETIESRWALTGEKTRFRYQNQLRFWATRFHGAPRLVVLEATVHFAMFDPWNPGLRHTSDSPSLPLSSSKPPLSYAEIRKAFPKTCSKFFRWRNMRRAASHPVA